MAGYDGEAVSSGMVKRARHRMAIVSAPGHGLSFAAQVGFAMRLGLLVALVVVAAIAWSVRSEPLGVKAG
jgi:hypothetical protein